MMPCIVGIDPGVTGGLAVVLGSELTAYDIPVVAGEINLEAVLGLLRLHRIDMAVIEGASSRPGQSFASTFKYASPTGCCARRRGDGSPTSHRRRDNVEEALQARH